MFEQLIVLPSSNVEQAKHTPKLLILLYFRVKDNEELIDLKSLDGDSTHSISVCNVLLHLDGLRRYNGKKFLRVVVLRVKRLRTEASEKSFPIPQTIGLW